MTRASIIIPALNEEANLHQNLPGIRQQMGPADELIVVDNGSKDNSVDVARQWATLIVEEPQRGRSRARNAGINRSQGQIIVLIDADCTPENGWLSELLTPFEDSSIGCVAGEIHTVDDGTPFGIYLTKKGHLAQVGPLAHPFLPYAQSGNAAYRRIVFDRIGLFDEALWAGHDADLSWRMQLETTYKLVPASLAAVSHRQDISYRSFLRQKRRHAHGAVLLYKKYKQHRYREVSSFKETYWEYRSILKRGFSCLTQVCVSELASNSSSHRDQWYQLVIEIGEKAGRLEGSIRNLTWYP